MTAGAHLSDETILATLRETGGIRAAAAHHLGISPRTLTRRLKTIDVSDLARSEFARAIERRDAALLQCASVRFRELVLCESLMNPDRGKNPLRLKRPSG